MQEHLTSDNESLDRSLSPVLMAPLTRLYHTRPLETHQGLVSLAYSIREDGLLTPLTCRWTRRGLLVAAGVRRMHSIRLLYGDDGWGMDLSIGEKRPARLVYQRVPVRLIGRDN